MSSPNSSQFVPFRPKSASSFLQAKWLQIGVYVSHVRNGRQQVNRKTLKSTNLNDLLATGEFGKLVGRTSETIRVWIEEGFIPPECVRQERGHYRIRRRAEHMRGAEKCPQPRTQPNERAVADNILFAETYFGQTLHMSGRTSNAGLFRTLQAT